MGFAVTIENVFHSPQPHPVALASLDRLSELEVVFEEVGGHTRTLVFHRDADTLGQSEQADGDFQARSCGRVAGIAYEVEEQLS